MPRTESERKPLTRSAIIDAAVALADSQGIDALSMRSVARALGVEAMSIYHHVAGKEAILDGMVDKVFSEFHTPDPGRPWADEMRRRSRSAREALTRHPWAVGLMDSRRNAGYENLRHHDAVLGCLFAAGFPTVLAGHAYALLDAHLYGFMVQELSLPTTPDGDLGEVAEEMLAEFPAEEFPNLARFTVEQVLRPGYSFGDEFDYGLDLVIDALDQQLAVVTS